MVQASPSGVYNSVPMVATGTFCPAATLGAPQTICKGSSWPILTVVTLKRSALGCCSQVNTSPTTTPAKLPGMDSNKLLPSTSRPRSVNKSSCSSRGKSA